MRTYLTDDERARLDRRVGDAEQRTGAQIVLALVERSDVYAEIPWKAFALGAGAAGLVLVLRELAVPSWMPTWVVPVTAAVILLTGAAAALLCVLRPGVARLFLDKDRAEVETRQYAESLFLSRQLFDTRSRSGILLLVSLFERKVVVLPDVGSAKRLGPEAPSEIVRSMTVELSAGRVASAFEAGLSALERRLASSVGAAEGADELPNSIIEGGRP